jgi:hypothetical protein
MVDIFRGDSMKMSVDPLLKPRGISIYMLDMISSLSSLSAFIFYDHMIKFFFPNKLPIGSQSVSLAAGILVLVFYPISRAKSSATHRILDERKVLCGNVARNVE